MKTHKMANMYANMKTNNKTVIEDKPGGNTLYFKCPSDEHGLADHFPF